MRAWLQKACEEAIDTLQWFTTERQRLQRALLPSRHQSRWAQDLQRPCWVVVDDEGQIGSHSEHDEMSVDPTRREEEDDDDEAMLWSHGKDTPMHLQARRDIALSGHVALLQEEWPARELCPACDAPLPFTGPADVCCLVCGCLHRISFFS